MLILEDYWSSDYWNKNKGEGFALAYSRMVKILECEEGLRFYDGD